VHVFYVILFDQVIDTSSARGGVLECIELSSMVDFSMGTINLMVGYMTSGHGPLHVLRADLQLKLAEVRSSCWLEQTKEFEESARTQVRARGDILPKAPGRSSARPSWYTGVLVRE
jgi:hypothetical protein